MNWLNQNWKPTAWIITLIAITAGAALTYPSWEPYARRASAFIQNREAESDSDPHQDHAAHDENPDTLKLTAEARKNIGLVTGVLSPSDFVKTVSVPAIVVERPGRSQVQIAAPMTGIITRVYPLERMAIEPEQPLFEIRLTHEDLVTTQSEYLTRLQKLDVAKKELKRLKDIGESVIPGKRIIEQQYEVDQAETALAATRESLLLHSMSEQQIADIKKSRKLIRDITITAPPYADGHQHADIEHQYHVQTIDVSRGQSVEAGDRLGVLADHCLLYVEGKAFEDDARRLIELADAEQTIDVAPVADNSDETLPLEVQSVSDQVDVQSRALKFYLLLPNELMKPSGKSSAKFVTWKYRPGQRMQVQIPTTDVLKNKIVLPASAVAIEGPNAFVFEQNGDNFDRIDVQVLYRDKDTVVLENNGQLIGSVIAMSGAYEMHLALKNQSGGAIDPHAGHSH